MFTQRIAKTFSSLAAKVLFWVTLIAGATFFAVVTVSTLVAERVVTQQILKATQAASEDVALELSAAGDPIELVQAPHWSSKLISRLSLSPGWRGIQVEVIWRGESSSFTASPTQTNPTVLIEFDEVPLNQHLSQISSDYLEFVLRRSLDQGELNIRMVASTEDIRSFIHAINRNAVWMGTTAWVLLLLIVAWLVYRTVSRPLREIAKKMGEVAKGKLSHQVDVEGASEVYPLIEAFNQMSNMLAETEQERTQLLQEVEELNRHLQRRVEEATAALAKAQADLARRDRLAAMGELVGTIAHEVGTPLNSVLAHLDLLAQDVPEGGEHAHRLGVVVNEIERVSDVIRRYLRSTRGPEPRHRLVAVDTLLHQSVRVFESLATLSQVTFLVEAQPVHIYTDPDFLAQIVRNLVSNALAAVKEGGTIKVSAGRSDDLFTLSVSDDGIGMDMETQRHIFEPFYTARPDDSGTGLGMPVARYAVLALGGDITVKSEPGVGTTVVVQIPNTSTSRVPTTADSRPSESEPGS